MPHQEFWQLLRSVENFYEYGERLEVVEPEAVYSPPIHSVIKEISLCKACQLCKERTKTVPGTGVLNPKLLVIGEGPGHEEDLTGQAFVGKAGQYLDKWLAAIGLSRQEDCFITNVVKCRPPNNRDPLPEEVNSCKPYLKQQIEFLNPKVILCVGRIASQVLTNLHDTPIGKLRKTSYIYSLRDNLGDIPLVTTYHPSGVLRNQELKAAVWQDLQLLSKLLQNREKEF